MPRYSYHCPHCGYEIERECSVEDRSKQTCEYGAGRDDCMADAANVDAPLPDFQKLDILIPLTARTPGKWQV